MTVKKVCLVCKKIFHIPTYTSKTGRGKYCSHKCHSKNQIGKKLSLKTRQRMSEIRKKNPIKSYWAGKKMPIEMRRKMSLAHKNKPNKGWFVKGQTFSKEFKKKLSVARKGRKLTREHIRNILRRRPMSSLEIKFQKIIDKYNLPYKFVGNGKFFIERKNPDFINVNGEKKAIEVFYREHKIKFRNKSLEEWKKERQEIFNKYGWEILFLDETQVNENFIKQILCQK